MDRLILCLVPTEGCYSSFAGTRPTRTRFVTHLALQRGAGRTGAGIEFCLTIRAVLSIFTFNPLALLHAEC